MSEFARRTVMVTGASGGLGPAVVRAFLDAGADQLVLVARDRERLARQYGGDDRLHLLPADLSHESNLARALADQLPDRSPSVLCHLAGGFEMGPAVHETGGDLLRRMMAINVETAMNAARAAAPAMIAAGQGAMVFVTAASAASGKAQMGAYIAAKSALSRLTESMAAELAPHGVRVNAVAPGTIDTPDNRAAMPTADRTQWVSPEDLAQVILFLASHRARAIRGAIVPVLGGA